MEYRISSISWSDGSEQVRVGVALSDDQTGDQGTIELLMPFNDNPAAVAERARIRLHHYFKELADKTSYYRSTPGV